MPSAPDDSDLAAILPGTWIVRSTNFPMWLTRERTSPRFTYTLLKEDPLTLRDDVSYRTVDGAEKHVLGTDKRSHDGFVWRGKGPLRVLRSRWSVIGADDDSTILAIRFEKTLFTHAGIDIIVREGVEVDELRSLVARNTEKFGLSAEDFASLTWLDTAVPPSAAPSPAQKPE
jgi:hypothetical protein